MASRITKAEFEGSKRRATRMQREDPNLSRSEALDQVAREEGFRNWSLLARSRFAGHKSNQPVEIPKPCVVVMRGIVRSRERGVLPKWWDENVPANHPEKHYVKFKWIPEYFEATSFSEIGVRQQLATMRRAIEFIDATELKPSNAWTQLFRKYRGKGPQGLDHTSVWRDAEKRYVLTTEPYLGRDAVADIRGWCDAHGWRMAVARNGRGIWNPCHADCPVDCRAHTQLIVLSPERNGADPDRVVATLK